MSDLLVTVSEFTEPEWLENSRVGADHISTEFPPGRPVRIDISKEEKEKRIHSEIMSALKKQGLKLLACEVVLSAIVSRKIPHVFIDYGEER